MDNRRIYRTIRTAMSMRNSREYSGQKITLEQFL
jgi:hypothetical protein